MVSSRMPINAGLITRSMRATVADNRTAMGKFFQKREGFSDLIHEFRFSFPLEHELQGAKLTLHICCAGGFIPS